MTDFITTEPVLLSCSCCQVPHDHCTEAPSEAPAPKKSNHQAKIVRVTELLPHPDPDTINLSMVEIDGYQIVTRKDSFKVGDFGVFIQPDSVVPQNEVFRFI